MESVLTSDCADALLDMVWYEAVTKRLSPEMEEMLERHLQECRSCRQRMFRLRVDLQNTSDCVNYGCVSHPLR
jgi:hypothetical protein